MHGPLKPGRGGHDLSPEEVAAVQRARILDAAVAVAAERGYPAMTVADVTRAAQVSRRTFYEAFPGKEACFLAAVTRVTERLTGAMAQAAAEAAGDWLTGVAAMTDTYLAALTTEPATAKVLLLELLAAGPRGLEHRAHTHRAFSAGFQLLYAAAREQDSALPEVPRVVFVAMNGAFDELLTELVRLGRFDELAGLRELALYLARTIPAGHHPAPLPQDPTTDGTP